MGNYAISTRQRWSALLLIAAGGAWLGTSAPTDAKPKRDRGEPPPLRAADLADKKQADQAPDAIDAALEHSEEKPAPAEPAKPALTCQAERPGAASGEAKVICTDGKTWTMRSAGLVMPTNQRCTTEHPECCQLGYGNLRELQIADLLRVGRGQQPVCHVRVEEVKTNPSVASAPVYFDEDDAPGVRNVPQLGIPISSSHSCPSDLYLVSGRCYDTKELMRAIRQPVMEDKNRVLISEGAPVAQRLRQEFDATGHCPENADNAQLLRLDDMAKRRAADGPLDVTPLLAKPETPGLTKPEAHLPTVCTFHAATREWLPTSFYCSSHNLCFAQTQSTLPHNCVRFERATGQSATSPSFFPLSHCQDLPSCFSAPGASECMGVARLTALGSGVFLMAQEDAKKERTDFSIILTRRRTRSPVELAVARQARTILRQIGRLYLSGEERERFNALIDAQPE